MNKNFKNPLFKATLVVSCLQFGMNVHADPISEALMALQSGSSQVTAFGNQLQSTVQTTGGQIATGEMSISSSVNNASNSIDGLNHTLTRISSPEYLAFSAGLVSLTAAAAQGAVELTKTAVNSLVRGISGTVAKEVVDRFTGAYSNYEKAVTDTGPAYQKYVILKSLADGDPKTAQARGQAFMAQVKAALLQVKAKDTIVSTSNLADYFPVQVNGHPVTLDAYKQLRLLSTETKADLVSAAADAKKQYDDLHQQYLNARQDFLDAAKPIREHIQKHADMIRKHTHDDVEGILHGIAPGGRSNEDVNDMIARLKDNPNAGTPDQIAANQKLLAAWDQLAQDEKASTGKRDLDDAIDVLADKAANQAYNDADLSLHTLETSAAIGSLQVANQSLTQARAYPRALPVDLSQTYPNSEPSPQ